MSIESRQTVAEVATSHPATVRVFQRLGIDFCCGGKATLVDACTKKGLDIDAVLDSLRSSLEPVEGPPSGTLQELIGYIVERHHTFTRSELERLGALMKKVASVHGDRHPELLRLKDMLADLADDLGPHMRKEENVLFPYVVELERSLGGKAPPCCFGTVANPIRMMEREHEMAGDLLASMRELTAGYALPVDACGSFRALYHGLEELEADLHRHIHLENNVLFPRALALEP